MKMMGGFCLAGVIVLLVWLAIQLGTMAAESGRKGQAEKEQCIVLKYQKDAEKFLDMECDRYVNYKQVNE